MYTKHTIPATGAHTIWTAGLTCYRSEQDSYRIWVRVCNRRTAADFHFAFDCPFTHEPIRIKISRIGRADAYKTYYPS